MYNRMQTLTQAEIQLIHDSAKEILGSTGVAFNESEALEIFKANDFKIEGKTVFFNERQVRAAQEGPPGHALLQHRPVRQAFHG